MGKDLAMTERAEAQQRLGRDLLGPAVAGYLGKLYRLTRAFEEERGAKVLYVTRAGIRIEQALNAYCTALDLPMPKTGETFYVSRLMACKGIWARDRERAEKMMVEMFARSSLMQFCEVFLRASDVEDFESLRDHNDERGSAHLPEFLCSDTPLAQVVRQHLTEQSALFERYMVSLAPADQPLLLVDTGWQGTIQCLLSDGFPERDIWGAYFARFGGETTDRRHWPKTIGIEFETDTVDPSRPETSLLEHRHLVEHSFEPMGDSVERLVEVGGRITCPQADVLAADRADPLRDPIFYGVMEHLQSLTRGTTPARIAASAAEAWRALARLILLPTPEEARAALDIQRDFDFGQTGASKLLLDAENMPTTGFQKDAQTAKGRVKLSLWKPGQVALDYAPQVARSMNVKRFGLGSDAFAPRALPRDIATATAGPVPAQPRVAVITRTMDRPNFLRRALESVSAQSFKDYVHVVVCDGGDINEVRKAIWDSDVCHSQVLLVDNVVNRGMEAASNIAIDNSESEFVIIHDDDDTWEPDFLQAAVGFLDRPDKSAHLGVVTQSTHVSEEVLPTGEIQVHRTRPFNPGLTGVHVFQMAMGNTFPPIAFLFRRTAYDMVGGFNADYPVLGDWDFNLRLLQHGEIGVIPKALSNYHHRDVGDTQTFGNSVIAGRDTHGEYAPIVRNALIRGGAGFGGDNTAMSTLMGMGLHFDSLLKEVRRAASKTPAQGVANGAVGPGDTAMTDALWCALQTLSDAVTSKDKRMLSRVSQVMTNQNLDRATRMALVVEALGETPTKNAPVPPPDFDTAAYVSSYPEAAAAVESGKSASPYEYFRKLGHARGHMRPSRNGPASVAGMRLYSPAPTLTHGGVVPLSTVSQDPVRVLTPRPDFEFDIVTQEPNGVMVHPTRFGPSVVAFDLNFAQPVRWMSCRLEVPDGRAEPIAFAARIYPQTFADKDVDIRMKSAMTLANNQLLGALGWTQLTPASGRAVTVEFKRQTMKIKVVLATRVSGMPHFAQAYFRGVMFH